MLAELDRRAQDAGDQLRRIAAARHATERALTAALRGDLEAVENALAELPEIELERIKRAARTIITGAEAVL